MICGEIKVVVPTLWGFCVRDFSVIVVVVVLFVWLVLWVLFVCLFWVFCVLFLLFWGFLFGLVFHGCD